MNDNVISGKSWAERVTPNNKQRSTNTLPTRPNNLSQSESTDDQSLFTTVHSRRKRRRPMSNENANGESQGQSHEPNHRAKPLMVGTMKKNSRSTAGVVAARQANYVQKSVFYIGNVEKSVSVEMMHDFISSLSVDVLSLFETKPRQRSRSISVDRPVTKAFRLCINSDHCDRLLVDSEWPAYISVSEWFFKPASQATQVKQNSNSATASNRAAADVAVEITGEHVDDGNNSMFVDASGEGGDDTLIMDDHSQGPAIQLTCTSNQDG
jgi:hypothetical protein